MEEKNSLIPSGAKQKLSVLMKASFSLIVQSFMKEDERIDPVTVDKVTLLVSGSDKDIFVGGFLDIGTWVTAPMNNEENGDILDKRLAKFWESFLYEEIPFYGGVPFGYGIVRMSGGKAHCSFTLDTLEEDLHIKPKDFFDLLNEQERLNISRH